MEIELKPLVWVATSLEDLRAFPDKCVALAGVVYVLHVFQKKSRKGSKTPRSDIDKIRARLKIAEEIHRAAEEKEESDEERK